MDQLADNIDGSLKLAYVLYFLQEPANTKKILTALKHKLPNIIKSAAEFGESQVHGEAADNNELFQKETWSSFNGG